MPDRSRRAVLRVAAGVAGAAAVHTFLRPSPAVATPSLITGSFVSAARGGITTNFAVARPPGKAGTLRPVIALHGKGSDAAAVMAGGVESGLAGAVNAGLPPIAVLFEHRFGLRPDVPAGTLVWDVRETAAHGVERYPFGADGLIDLRCAARSDARHRPSITVRSSVPLTIDLRWAGGRERIAISPS
jgi:hypothetical protein